MTAPDLAARLADDLDGTFELLVLQFQGPVFRFAWRYCGNPHDAEEIAQDAFVRAYRALQGYDPERIEALHLLPWLLTITVNLARNRARGKRLATGTLETVGDLVAARIDEPAEVTERRDLADRLVTALLDLPPRYRSAVILRHVLGLGYDEIAAVLDKPPGTVKSHVHRGLQLLREQASTPGLALLYS